jgi:hypothetical protein
MEKLTVTATAISMVKAARLPMVFDSAGAQVIRHDPGRLPEILDECEQVLAEDGALPAT